MFVPFGSCTRTLSTTNRLVARNVKPGSRSGLSSCAHSAVARVRSTENFRIDESEAGTEPDSILNQLAAASSDVKRACADHREQTDDSEERQVRSSLRQGIRCCLAHSLRVTLSVHRSGRLTH